MSITLFIGFMSLLIGLYIWIGFRSSKALETNEDYFLMGRNLTAFPLCMTLLATQLGGGSLMGAAQEAYLKGWIVLAYPLGAAIGLVILGMGFGAKLRRLNMSTIAEIFEKVYGSRSQRLIASALSIISFYLILVGQGIAARKFFLSMGVGDSLFIFFWCSFVAYTVMGGFKAVVDTDIVQALLILAGLFGAWFCIDWSQVQSFTSQASSAISVRDVPWSSWLLMPMLFMLIEQDMGQRCFAAKTPGIVGPSAITAGILLFVSSAIAIAFGVFARSLDIEGLENSSVLIEAVKALTNPTISLFFMGAILMAVASTADSIISSISSNLTCDFFPSKNMNLSRILTLTTGLSALAVGYLFDNVVTVLMLSYELSVTVLFVPVIAAVLCKQPSVQGAYLAMAGGAIGFVLFRTMPIPIPKELLSLALSYSGYLIGKRIPLKIPEKQYV
jgi:SSS family solute:Na+ symporter